jgi:ubiquinone/menaquinone biosynthesis C-methylase UbiE
MPEDQPMLETYEEYYRRVASSRAFSRYCELTFGHDLSQDGFSDRAQLDLLIELLGIGPGDSCLDLGCGNGRIAAYIAGRSGARIDGIDYSAAAIEAAAALAPAGGRLGFALGDINSLDLPAGAYSAIYLVDSIYFSRDYEKTLCELMRALGAGGRLGLCYSEFVFDEERKTAKIEADETAPARIFRSRGWAYEARDLAREHYELMLRKRRSALACREELEGEGNAWLFDRVHEQSIGPELGFEDFCRFTNRYLYRVEAGARG